MNIKPEVIANAKEIYAGLKCDDGKPYCPANGTEGSIFERNWCDKCTQVTEDGCNIFITALCGGQPEEWFYFKNKPICTAFAPKMEVQP